MDKRELTPTHRKLVALLRRAGSLSRLSLAAASGLTTAAVSMMTRDMLNLGILEESDKEQGRRGPPQINLRVVAQTAYVLGVYAEYDLICLLVMDYAGHCVAEKTLRGDFHSVLTVTDTLSAAVAALMAQQRIPPDKIRAINLALPARFDGGTLPVWMAPGLVGWRGVDIASQLSERLNCPVQVENDANCAAIGELNFGDAERHDCFFYLYIGKGIGGALVLNGDLYHGQNGNAGEIGALRPRPLSRPSFDDLRDCLRAAGADLPSSPDDARWEALADTPAGSDWIARAACELFDLIHTVTALLDPPCVYLGGTLPLPFTRRLKHAVEKIWPQQNNEAPLILPPLKISTIPAQNSAAFGAAALALRQW